MDKVAIRHIHTQIHSSRLSLLKACRRAQPSTEESVHIQPKRGIATCNENKRSKHGHACKSLDQYLTRIGIKRTEGRRKWCKTVTSTIYCKAIRYLAHCGQMHPMPNMKTNHGYCILCEAGAGDIRDNRVQITTTYPQCTGQKSYCKAYRRYSCKSGKYYYNKRHKTGLSEVNSNFGGTTNIYCRDRDAWKGNRTKYEQASTNTKCHPRTNPHTGHNIHSKRISDLLLQTTTTPFNTVHTSLLSFILVVVYIQHLNKWITVSIGRHQEPATNGVLTSHILFMSPSPRVT